MGGQNGKDKSNIDQPSGSAIANSPLLAWCSKMDKKINVIDLETKRSHVTFDGAGSLHNHIKEIQDTKLLVSLHDTKIEIFDISKKGKANKIYSFEADGVFGNADVTYSSRRNILGAISVTGETAYHLFNVDAKASSDDNIVKLNRKSKWHSQNSTQKAYNSALGEVETNRINSLDFNPSGESIATIDSLGVCLISDVNTDNYVFHLQVGKEDEDGRCRWSTNSGEPFLFVKHDRNKLNILDVEKKVLTLSNPVELDQSGVSWIDMCPSNGNLLVSGGYKNIEIIDKRESKIVKTFPWKDSAYCVRWNTSGNMIASTSYTEAKVLDLKTGKVLYTGTNSDKGVVNSVCFI